MRYNKKLWNLAKFTHFFAVFSTEVGIFAADMEQMQFAAIVVLALLLVKLLLLPRRVAVHAVVNKARWLMVGGTVLLLAHFVLQYILKLRLLGVTQAVMLNLVFFIPVTLLFSLAVLYLQRRGRISAMDIHVGWITWAVAVAMIAVAAAIDGQPLLSDTPELHTAEVAASVCFAAMLGYFTWRQIVTLRSMHNALQNYYDSDMDGVLQWMKYSIVIMLLMALSVPVVIFFGCGTVAVPGLIFIACIFYFIDSFFNYVLSSAPRKLQEAEEKEVEEEEAKPAVPASLPRVEQAVEQWVAKGGHLQSGMKMPNAADEMSVPRYLLSAWLRHKGYKYAEWMTDLRIEEAKRQLRDHPDWNNEAIAIHCGFSDRCYFQKKFKERTGVSPTEYQNNQAS